MQIRGGSLNFMNPKQEGDQNFNLGFGEGYTIFLSTLLLQCTLNKSKHTNNLFGSYN